MVKLLNHRSRPGGLFPLIVCCLFSVWVSAQSTDDCNWNFVIYNQPQPSVSPNDPPLPAACTDQDACAPVYFYVYVERNGDQNCTGVGCPYALNIAKLSITGVLTATASTYTGKILSKLNVKGSTICTGSQIPINDPFNPNAFDFSVDTNNTFSLAFLGAAGETTSLSVYGRKLLCVIAVDAFPGEAVNLNVTSTTLVHPGQSACIPPPPVGYASNKSVNLPAACAPPSLSLRLGSVENVNDPDFPNRKRVAVFMSSGDALPTTYTIESLDFLMAINSQQLNGEVFSQIVNAAVVTDLYEEPPFNSSMDRRVYAEGKQVQITTSATNTPNPDNTLFYLVFNGPMLASDCAITDAMLTQGRRMQINGVCCKPMTGDTIRQLSWNGSNCPTNCSFITARVEDSPLSPANSCTQLLFQVNLESTQSDTLESAVVTLDVHYTGSLAWDTSLSASSYCTPSVCITSTAIPGLPILRITIDIAANMILGVGSAGAISLARLGFSGAGGCITGVTVYDAVLRQKGAQEDCLPQAQSAFNPDEDADMDDLCAGNFPFSFEPWWKPGEAVADVAYTLSGGLPQGCTFAGISATGMGALCLCQAPDSTQVFTPVKDDNPLNGVSTYDLVLISRHILGLDPFDNPYQMIAADADRFNKVTTFDIVEFRKLILGVYDTLPNNTSWRFVDKSFQFPNLNNPFQTPFPEEKTFKIPPFGVDGHFIALKVGDVNESAFYGRPEQAVANLLWAPMEKKADEQNHITTIAVAAQQPLRANAWQLTLRYPADYVVKDVRPVGPELPGPLHFGWHAPAPGELRVLWFDAERDAYTYSEGEPLFYLDLEPNGQPATPVLRIDERVLPAEAYTVDGQVRSLLLEKGHPDQLRPKPEAAKPEETPLWNAVLYPNPNTGRFRLTVTAPENGGATLELIDQQGAVLHREQRSFTGGDTVVDTDAWPRLQPGAYTLRVQTPLGVRFLPFAVIHRM